MWVKSGVVGERKDESRRKRAGERVYTTVWRSICALGRTLGLGSGRWGNGRGRPSRRLMAAGLTAWRERSRD